MLNFYTILTLFVATTIFILTKVTESTLSLLLIMNTLIICIGFYKSLKLKLINIDLIYWVFNYLFFVIAVVVQSVEVYYPTNLPVNSESIIFGQFLIFIWNLIYFLSRKKSVEVLQSSNVLTIPKSVSNLYFIFSTLITIYIFLNNGIQFFIGEGSIVSNVSQPIQLIVTSTVYGIVFSNLIFQYSLRKKGDIITNFLIFIAFLQFIYVMNPFNTNRYYLGFVIIFFLWYFYRKSINAYKFSVVFFLGIIVVFPFFNNFRYGFNSDISFTLDSSLEQFNELHFDAFANFLASIEYTVQYSLLLGGNFIGSLLFFVPSSVWAGKPEGSGTRIGDYLINHYDFHFNNLSNPLVSEFYLSFGVIGIVVGAYIFAQIINKLEGNSGKSLEYEILYGIMLSYLFILLRGSLIVAFSSIVGSIFFMIVLPQILMVRNSKKVLNNSNLDWG